MFDQRDQFVELRPGVRAGKHDAHGMKQLLALGAGLGFHLVHDGLEALGGERSGRLGDGATGEGGDNVFGFRPGEDFGVIRRTARRGRVVLEYKRRARRKLVQSVNRGR